MKYIITGTGRCGTNFMAKLLTSAGVPCGRENIFNTHLQPIGGWDADSSWMALPYLERFVGFKDTPIVHLVRNPWSVLRGWLFDFESVFSVWRSGTPLRPTNKFLINNCIGISSLESPIDKALHFYTNWNSRIEALRESLYSVILIRAEESAEIILTKIGIEGFNPKKLFNNRLENTRQRCILTNKEIDHIIKTSPLYGDFKLKAEEYGYESP